MSPFTDAILLDALGLTEVDRKNIRESDGYIDVRTGNFIPSHRSLRQIIRSKIEHTVGLEKPRKKAAKERKPQD